MQLNKIKFMPMPQYMNSSNKIYLVLIHSYIAYYVPPGLVVSATPLFTRTHSFHLISGSGWCFYNKRNN